MLFFKKKVIDAELMVGILAGGTQQTSAENALYERYFYLIKDATFKHKISEDDAASAYSDAILSVIESVKNGKFEGRAELKTYIYQIFSNKCVDILRKNTTNKASVHQGFSLDDFVLEFADETKDILHRLMVQHDIDKLRNILQKIGDKCKQMILAWGEGYSDEEIALQLQYNTASVAKTSRLRCLEKLKEMYF
jgi:RNA polymerase sigma factor (sigma-70 family)